jgi:carboxyl-terminal processing protease
MKRRLLIFFLPTFFVGLLLGASLPTVRALPEKIYKSLDLFSKVLYIVEKEYVEEVDGQNLVYGAIKGMLGTLDPYSVFLTPDVYKELKVDTVGRFGGVGLEITLQDGILTVVSPMEDTPAAKAGIHPGDRILKINGKSTKGMNLADAVARMRGSRKSKVNLTLYREGKKKPFDVTLEREVIQIKSVKGELLPDKIAYLRITSFQERTTDELKEKIKELEKQAGGSFNGIILDLRNNPGGLLEEAVTVSDLFLDKGVIVTTKGRVEVTDERQASPGGDYIKEKMVVLINRGSASASEIVAGALKDNGRAKTMGTQSFGKGSVQTVIDLGEGTGLKLTIAKYYTPSGVSINGIGIAPDYEVPLPKNFEGNLFLDPQKDPQRQAAIDFLKSGKIPPAIKKAEKNEEESVTEVEEMHPESDKGGK